MYDPKFFKDRDLADPYEQSNLTIRLEAVVKTATVPGDVVQCGVYRGASLATVALLVMQMGLPKTVWGCDSFTGFPAASGFDKIDGVLPEKAQPDYFADTSVALVEKVMKDVGVDNIVRLLPGYFDSSLSQLPAKEFSLLILDCDLYNSYQVSLQALYSRLNRDGIIIFDEYFSPKYPGARQAIDEFFADKPEKPQLAQAYLQYNPYERWYVVKE